MILSGPFEGFVKGDASLPLEALYRRVKLVNGYRHASRIGIAVPDLTDDSGGYLLKQWSGYRHTLFHNIVKRFVVDQIIKVVKRQVTLFINDIQIYHIFSADNLFTIINTMISIENQIRKVYSQHM